VVIDLITPAQILKVSEKREKDSREGRGTDRERKGFESVRELRRV